MASNKTPLKGYMDGIDISAWQDTIDITKVPCDFVIVKATEGTDYKNRFFAKHCDQAMKAGKLLGRFIMQMAAILTARRIISLRTVRNMRAKPYLCSTGRDRTIHSLAGAIGRGARSGAIMCTEKPG